MNSKVKMYKVYKLSFIDGSYYVGVTSDIWERIYYHETDSGRPVISKICKFGVKKMGIQILLDGTLDECLELEASLITPDVVNNDKKCLNRIPGGSYGPFTSYANPMNSVSSKQKMIESQDCKPVIIDGVEYYGVREASRRLGISRQLCVYRLTSKHFTEWNYKQLG